jgi:hypothetical protein
MEIPDPPGKTTSVFTVTNLRNKRGVGVKNCAQTGEPSF